MKRWPLVGAWLAGLCLAGGCGRQESDVPAGPVWTSQSSQLDALGADHAVNRYQLRPPKDFQLVAQKLEAREVAFVTWISPTPAVGHGSVLALRVSDQPKMPIKGHLDGALLELRMKVPDFKQTEAEAGSIQGKAFIR